MLISICCSTSGYQQPSYGYPSPSYDHGYPSYHQPSYGGKHSKHSKHQSYGYGSKIATENIFTLTRKLQFNFNADYHQPSYHQPSYPSPPAYEPEYAPEYPEYPASYWKISVVNLLLQQLTNSNMQSIKKYSIWNKYLRRNLFTFFFPI